MEVLWCSRRLVAFELELSARCCERILVAVGLELEIIFLPKEALFEEENEGSVAPVLTKESTTVERFLCLDSVTIFSTTCRNMIAITIKHRMTGNASAIGESGSDLAVTASTITNRRNVHPVTISKGRQEITALHLQLLNLRDCFQPSSCFRVLQFIPPSQVHPLVFSILHPSHHRLDSLVLQVISQQVLQCFSAFRILKRVNATQLRNEQAWSWFRPALAESWPVMRGIGGSSSASLNLLTMSLNWSMGGESKELGGKLVRCNMRSSKPWALKKAM